MPARRRRSLFTYPIERTRMWDAKMNPEVYREYLLATKPRALEKVAKYQSSFQTILTNVKGVIVQLEENPSLTQEYMWYAEKLWKYTQTYSSQGLQLQADALFLWYLARGLREDVLRAIARTLGIKISDTEIIMERLGVPAMLKVIAKGSIITNGTEQQILEYVGLATISGWIDLSNMKFGDEIIIRVYTKIKEDGDYVLYTSEPYMGEQTKPALCILPRLTGYAYRVTIEQTAGSYKSFDYLFVKGLTGY